MQRFLSGSVKWSSFWLLPGVPHQRREPPLPIGESTIFLCPRINCQPIPLSPLPHTTTNKGQGCWRDHNPGPELANLPRLGASRWAIVQLLLAG